jgi:hypothetical protein
VSQRPVVVRIAGKEHGAFPHCIVALSTIGVSFSRRTLFRRLRNTL